MGLAGYIHFIVGFFGDYRAGPDPPFTVGGMRLLRRYDFLPITGRFDDGYGASAFCQVDVSSNRGCVCLWSGPIPSKI